MKVCARQFNLYLALALMLCGCQTDANKKDKAVAALRIHIEANTYSSGVLSDAQTISVLRSDPVSVTIGTEPVLTEANIIAARIMDLPGGFAIEIKFDETGSWTLEQFSAANPGKHFTIFGQWGEKITEGRWLAAPLITHRIGDGVLVFTPDATREEADRLTLGLNNVAQKKLKGAF